MDGEVHRFIIWAKSRGNVLNIFHATHFIFTRAGPGPDQLSVALEHNNEMLM